MNTKYAVCINNKGFEASLEVGKLYEIIEAAEAESDEMIRVIDEDGENQTKSEWWIPSQKRNRKLLSNK